MKNKILIFILGLMLVGVGSFSNAYTFTWDELTQLNSNKDIIKNSSNSDMWSYYNQLSKRYNILENNEKLGNMSKELRNYARNQFQIKKDEAKSQSESTKTKLVNKYNKNITLDIEYPEEKCTWRYNKIDNISFANDFPTALTIAVWYRESSCGYYLPNNGDGPFQIVSKDYWTGDIDEETFEKTIQDFIDFSKNKIKKYNDRNEWEYDPIELTYTKYNYNDLWKFAGLYNGLSGSTMIGEIWPANEKYFLEWYDDYENSKKYGLFAMFIKTLQWELDNN